MQKIPMQIYIDQESVAFYQDYARRRAISFAAAVREALKEKQQAIHRAAMPKKIDHPLLTAIHNARASLGKIPYHNANKSDDELVYG